MKPTDILRKEHSLFKRALMILVIGIKKIEKGENLPEDFFVDIIDFIDNFIFKYHYKKEEGILFDEMEKAGVFTQDLPLEEIQAEHDTTRRYLEFIINHKNNFNVRYLNKYPEKIEVLKKLMDVLIQHSRHEDRVLFPLSDNLITEKNQQKILEYYKQMDELNYRFIQNHEDKIKNLEDFLGITQSYREIY